MRVRVGDTWLSIGLFAKSIPDASLVFVVDKETGLILDRAIAPTKTISEVRGAEATLKSGVVSAIKTKFSKNYLKPTKSNAELQEVESYLGPAYKDAWGEDPNIVWEDADTN